MAMRSIFSTMPKWLLRAQGPCARHTSRCGIAQCFSTDTDTGVDILADALVKRWLSPAKFLEFADEDNSGCLEFVEYMRVLDEFRLNVPTKVAEQLFDSLDIDGSGTVSGAELHAALTDKIEAKIQSQVDKSVRGELDTLYDDAPRLKLVSLVAHNNMKPSMMAFVARYLWFFSKVPIITTGSTGRALEQKLGITVDTKVCSGPLGGDQEIGALISEGEVGLVFFFRDPLSAHPHDSDINALTRICDVHDCVICTNPATAVGLMEALSRTPVGTVLHVASSDHAESDVVKKYKDGQSKVIDEVSK